MIAELLSELQTPHLPFFSVVVMRPCLTFSEDRVVISSLNGFGLEICGAQFSLLLLQ